MFTRTAAFINEARLVANIKALKRLAAADAMYGVPTCGQASPLLLAVLKANAYGHDAVKAALVCQQNGVDFAGVACANEGAMLRAAGVTLPILIFGVCLGKDIETALTHGLIQTVGSVECARAVSKTAARLNTAADVHIEVDTGMAWIGFSGRWLADSGRKDIEDIKSVCNMPGINVTGIYSHLAASDWTDKSFVVSQLQKFNGLCEQLAQNGVNIPFRHISNSGTIVDGVENFGLSMVRAGITVYGLPPSSSKSGADELAKLGILPVMTLKSKVAHVGWIEQGQSVGYSRTFIAERRTKFAVVSAGYADGYSRLLSNKGRVLINGEYAPVIGNVCMDHFMTDVTHIQNVSPGDEVVLMGEQKGKNITAEELADICQTINYEIVTGISERVFRIFY